jgi:exonuclease VII small subunit
MKFSSCRQTSLTTALLLFLLLELVLSASGFLAPGTSVVCCRSAKLAVVTEEQVLAAVEQAEALWTEALEARKKADEAAGKAEAANANGKSGHITSHLSPQIVSLASLADSMEQAESFVEESVKYAEEADKIEATAEAALEQTEKLLEQHLKDFPNSSLAQDE